MMSAEVGRIGFILPMYGKFAYARRAAFSFFEHSPDNATLICVDDASPNYNRQDWDAWKSGLPLDRCHFYRFPSNGGLTRSWNYGLTWARDNNCEFAVCGNSDILFTPHWYEALIRATETGVSLAAPVTNAPGQTNHGKQSVANFFPQYSVSDSKEDLEKVAGYLHRTYPLEKADTANAVNGFFMFARTDRWWEGAYNSDHVFNPANKMIGNEDELQRRWHAKGWKTGFCPASFIFHYRSVTRGARFNTRGAFRAST